MSGVQSRVCRSDVAGLEHEEIPWNDGVGRDHDAVAVPHHPCPWRRHRAQRHHRTLRPVFLKKPDDRVDDDDRADRARVEQLTQRRGEHARADEQPDNGAHELASEESEGALGFFTADLVRTKLTQSPLRLG